MKTSFIKEASQKAQQNKRLNLRTRKKNKIFLSHTQYSCEFFTTAIAFILHL